MLDNCFRFAPRDSIPGLIAKICKYLKDHPGWSEDELEEQINKFIGANGVESFNGRIGNVTLDKNDVNNLKIASAYFAEGDESIDSLDLVSLYNHGVRFVFTDFNSVTSGYNLAFVLDYFDASGEVVYYPVSTGSGGGGNIVSVNGKTGEVHLKVVDVSNGNSPDENAYIFIDESDDYPDVISSDSSKLGGELPSYYASAEEVSQLKDEIANLGKKYRLLASITLEEDVTQVQFDSDEIGNEFGFSSIICVVKPIFETNGNMMISLLSKNGTNTNADQNALVVGGFIGNMVTSGRTFVLRVSEKFEANETGKTQMEFLVVADVNYGDKIRYAIANMNRYYGGGIKLIRLRAPLFQQGSVFNFYGIDER